MAEKNKKKNKKNQDAIAVLAVLAIIILVGVVCALFQRNPDALKFTKMGSVTSKKQEEASQTGKTIVICVTAISVIIVGMFIRSRIIKKREAKNAIKEKEEKIKEFLAAKERVEKARRDSFLNAGISEINKRREKKGMYISDFEDDDERLEDRKRYSIADMEKELELRQRHTRYSTYEEKNFFARILDTIRGFFKKDSIIDKDDQENDDDDFEEEK